MKSLSRSVTFHEISSERSIFYIFGTENKRSASRLFVFVEVSSFLEKIQSKAKRVSTAVGHSFPNISFYDHRETQPKLSLSFRIYHLLGARKAVVSAIADTIIGPFAPRVRPLHFIQHGISRSLGAGQWGTMNEQETVRTIFSSSQ